MNWLRQTSRCHIQLPFGGDALEGKRELRLFLPVLHINLQPEFDGVGSRPIEEHVEMILVFLEQCGPDRLLLSHDAGWYWIGEPGGGRQRSFTTLAGELLPTLRSRGVSDAMLHQLVVENPARAFSIADVMM